MTRTTVFLIAAAAAAAADHHTAIEWNNQATRLFAGGQYAEAEAIYRQALDAFRQIAPEGARDAVIAMENLGALLAVTGRYRQSVAILEQALRRSDGELGPESDESGHALYNLAAVYRALGDLPNAEANALRGSRTGSPEQRLGSRMVLACTYIDEVRPAEAEPILKAALPDARGDLAVAIRTNLAEAELQEHRTAEAERYAADALKLAASSLPRLHPARAAALHEMALVERLEGRFPEAETLYRQSLETWKGLRGPSHPDVAQELLSLASFFHERGRERAAEGSYQRAIAILEPAFGAGHPVALSARNDLADVLRAERRYAEAERMSRSTLALLEKSLEASDSRLARARANRKRLLAETATKAPATATNTLR